MNIDGVVHSVTSDISGYEKNIKRLEALETKQAELTEKFNDDSIKADVKIAKSKERIEALQAKSIELSKDESDEAKAAKKAVESKLAKEERALEKLNEKREVVERIYKKNLERTQKELDSTRKKVEKVNVATMKFKATLSKLRPALGALSVAGLAAALDRVMTKLDGLAKRAKDVNLTASQLQELSHQAELAGVSASNLDTAIKSFNKNVSLATMGSGKAQASLEFMGISLKNNEGLFKSQNEILKEAAEYFAKNAGAAENAGLASKIFGEEGARLVQVFEKGQDSIDKFFNAEGIDEAAAAAERYKDHMENVENAIFKFTTTAVKGMSRILDLGDDMFNGGLGSTEAIRQEYREREKYEKWDTERRALREKAKKDAIEAEKKALDDLRQKYSDLNKIEPTAQEKKLALEKEILEINERESVLAKSVREAQVERYKKQNAYYQAHKKEFDAYINGEIEHSDRILVIKSKHHLALLETKEHYQDLIRLKELLAKKSQIEAEEAKLFSDLAEAQMKKNTALTLDTLKKLADKRKGIEAEEARAKAEQMRIATAQEEYKIKLQMQILERTLSKEEFAKLKIQERALELVKQKLCSEEEALKFAKLEAKLKNPKSDKIVYDKESVNKAQKILDSGKAGKRTLVQAQQIVNGEEIDYKNRVGVFSKIKGQRESENFGDLKNLPTSLGTWGTPVQPVTVSKLNEEQIKGGAVSLRDINASLGNIHNDIKGIPDTLREVLNG